MSDNQEIVFHTYDGLLNSNIMLARELEQLEITIAKTSRELRNHITRSEILLDVLEERKKLLPTFETVNKEKEESK